MSAREHGANLCAAAKRGSIDEASILLGRDDVASFIDFADEEGFTAVLWASNGKLKILQLLLPHDPNLEVVDGEGMTPLMTAASMDDNLACLKLLLSAGADVAAVDLNGHTALWHASDDAKRAALKEAMPTAPGIALRPAKKAKCGLM